MPDEAMVCTCCGRYKVTARQKTGQSRIAIFRVTYDGMKLADVHTPEEVEAILASNGIPLSNLRKAT